jgi:uncharacterized membrane protein YtjA (UPF0391 family)
MLGWTIIYLVCALMAAFFGWVSPSNPHSWVAKALFLCFSMLFVVSLIFSPRDKDK